MSPRIGVRAGPFYASTSTRGCAPWAVAFFVLFILVAVAIDYPYVSIPVGVAVVALLVWRITAVRRQAVHAARTSTPSSDAAQHDTKANRCTWCGSEGGRHRTDCPVGRPKQ